MSKTKLILKFFLFEYRAQEMVKFKSITRVNRISCFMALLTPRNCLFVGNRAETRVFTQIFAYLINGSSQAIELPQSTENSRDSHVYFT